MVFKKIIRTRGKPVFQSRSAQQGSPRMSRNSCPGTACVVTGGPRPLRRKRDQSSSPDLMQGMTESLEMIEARKKSSERKRVTRNAKKSKSHGSNVKYTKQLIDWK